MIANVWAWTKKINLKGSKGRKIFTVNRQGQKMLLRRLEEGRKLFKNNHLKIRQLYTIKFILFYTYKKTIRLQT